MIAFATAAVLAVAGIAGSVPNSHLLGYTNGKECFNANCSTQPTLIKRMECCETSCPGTWYIECADAAIGEDPSAALKTLTWAAATIDYATPFSFPGDLDRAASFFVACARSTNPLIARMARGFAAESVRLTAILKMADPHNEQGFRTLTWLDVPGVVRLA